MVEEIIGCKEGFESIKLLDSRFEADIEEKCFRPEIDIKFLVIII